MNHECSSGVDNCDARATCINIECAYVTDNCDVNAKCTKNDGSFSCARETGYNGDHK